MAGKSGAALATYGLNYLNINATKDGDNELIKKVTGSKIVVLGYALNVNAAGVVAFKDSANTYASFEFTDGGGATYEGGPFCPAFEISANEPLLINCAAGVDALGHLVYIVV